MEIEASNKEKAQCGDIVTWGDGRERYCSLPKGHDLPHTDEFTDDSWISPQEEDSGVNEVR